MFLKHWFLCVFTLGLIYKSNGATRQNSIPGEEEEYQIRTEVGKSITLPCGSHTHPQKTTSVYWEKEGPRGPGEEVLPDGGLFLPHLSRAESKLYTCLSEDGLILAKIRLDVKGPPIAPENVTVSATSGEAVVMWHQPLDETVDAVPTTAKVLYGLRHSPGRKRIEALLVGPQVLIRVPDLEANATYDVTCWASNPYGEGPGVLARVLTPPDPGGAGTLRVESEWAWLTGVVALLVVVNGVGAVALFVYARVLLFRPPSPKNDDSEQLELVPNIIENPAFYGCEDPGSKDAPSWTAGPGSRVPTNPVVTSRTHFL